MGYYDLAHDPGEYEYFGGARAGCWTNMTSVGGIVLAPDDSHACRCACQNQATIALKEHGIRPPQIAAVAESGKYRHDLRRRSHTFVGRLTVVMSHPQENLDAAKGKTQQRDMQKSRHD